MRANKPVRIQVEAEADNYRDGMWRYRVLVIGAAHMKRHFAAGRATPEHVLELAREAMRAANGVGA